MLQVFSTALFYLDVNLHLVRSAKIYSPVAHGTVYRRGDDTLARQPRPALPRDGPGIPSADAVLPHVPVLRRERYGLLRCEVLRITNITYLDMAFRASDIPVDERSSGCALNSATNFSRCEPSSS